jgi:hypothetical protein
MLPAFNNKRALGIKTKRQPRFPMPFPWQISVIAFNDQMSLYVQMSFFSQGKLKVWQGFGQGVVLFQWANNSRLTGFVPSWKLFHGHHDPEHNRTAPRLFVQQRQAATG